MSITEAFKKEKESNTPKTPDNNSRTLASIMSSKESALFGKMLEAEKVDAKLLERLRDGNLNDTDLEDLGEFRVKFNEKFALAEEVKAKITSERVEMMVNGNPEFKKIADLVGSEKVKEIILSQMTELALTDEARFQEIVDKVDILKRSEAMAESIDTNVEEIIKKHNLDKSKVAKALVVNDPKERLKQLTGLIEESSKAIGFWFKPQNARKAAEELDTKRGLITAVLGNMEHDVHNIGGVIALDINSNPDLRNSVARAIIGEKAPKQETASFKDMKGDMPTEEGMVSEWEEHIKTIGDWDKLTEPQREAKRGEFLKSYKDSLDSKTDSKRGFWARVFKATFSKSDPDSKKDLSKIN